MTFSQPRRYTAEEIYYAAEHARPLKWQDSAGEHEIDLEALLYSAAEDALRLEQFRNYLLLQLNIVAGDYPSPDREVLEDALREFDRLASAGRGEAPKRQT